MLSSAVIRGCEIIDLNVCVCACVCGQSLFGILGNHRQPCSSGTRSLHPFSLRLSVFVIPTHTFCFYLVKSRLCRGLQMTTLHSSTTSCTDPDGPDRGHEVKSASVGSLAPSRQLSLHLSGHLQATRSRLPPARHNLLFSSYGLLWSLSHLVFGFTSDLESVRPPLVH